MADFLTIDSPKTNQRIDANRNARKTYALAQYVYVMMMMMMMMMTLIFVPFQKVPRELYGPSMIIFTLIAILLYQMKTSGHTVVSFSAVFS